MPPELDRYNRWATALFFIRASEFTRLALCKKDLVARYLETWSGFVNKRLERETFDLADRCADGRVSMQSIIDSFHALIGLAGYAHALGGAVIAAGHDPRFFFNTLPQAWMKLLEANADLLAAGLNGSREAARRMEPFESLEVQRGRTMTPLEKRSHALTTGFGWRSIFVVPAHGPMGYRAVVLMKSLRSVELNPRVRAALRLASLSVLDRCRTDRHLGRTPAHEPALSARELACFREVVSGASDKDIARKLGLTHHTVHDHIERARLKLKTKTRAQAAAMLVLLGRV